MLFGEPTLSARSRFVGEVPQVMQDLAALGMTMAVVTHEIGFTREVADQVVFMWMAASSSRPELLRGHR